MRKRNAQLFLLAGASAAAGLFMLASCNDNLTGQDGEPNGPLKVTRLTLFDNGASRAGHPVTTDTSVPPDCTKPEVAMTQTCTNDPFKDKYGVLKSPPNPDSIQRLRVVFNKAPLKIGDLDLEPVPEEGLPTVLKLSDPSVISLTCKNCSTDGGKTGVPATFNSLQLTGSDLSPDPEVFAYGPGLQMEVLNTCVGATARYKCCAMGLIQPPAGKTCSTLVAADVKGDPGDPLAALEPGTTYSVVLNPALAGRNSADKVLLDDKAKALLTFTTEPFKPLSVAGHTNLPYPADPKKNPAEGETTATDVDSDSTNGDGSAAKPYVLSAPIEPTESVWFTVNAGIDDSVWSPQTISVKISVAGGPTTDFVGDIAFYDPAQHTISFTPKEPMSRTRGVWATLNGNETAEITITLKGAELRDVSQVPGHPAGKGIHVIGKDITIRATVKNPPPKT